MMDEDWGFDRLLFKVGSQIVSRYYDSFLPWFSAILLGGW